MVRETGIYRPNTPVAWVWFYSRQCTRLYLKANKSYSSYSKPLGQANLQWFLKFCDVTCVFMSTRSQTSSRTAWRFKVIKYILGVYIWKGISLNFQSIVHAWRGRVKECVVGYIWRPVKTWGVVTEDGSMDLKMVVADLKIQTLTSTSPVVTERLANKCSFKEQNILIQMSPLFVLALPNFFGLTCGTWVFEVVLDYRERHFEVGYQPACRS